ncbi:hypothetical protein [Streptomyces chartreusis]|uniref:hypothetical protein n=1 Tax=Streptomyces chartreusis TaxID=1969 RepID=UPI00381F0476
MRKTEKQSTISFTVHTLPREEMERRLWANIENLSDMKLMVYEPLEVVEAPHLSLVSSGRAAA